MPVYDPDQPRPEVSTEPKPDLVGDLIKLFHLSYADAVKVVDRGFDDKSMVKYLDKMEEARGNPKIQKPDFLVRKYILEDYLKESRAEVTQPATSKKSEMIAWLNKLSEEDNAFYFYKSPKDGAQWWICRNAAVKGKRVGPTSYARPYTIMDLTELEWIEKNLIKEDHIPLTPTQRPALPWKKVAAPEFKVPGEVKKIIL